MKAHILVPLLAATTTASPPPYHHHKPPPNHDSLKVSTSSGLIHGKIDPEFPNVRQFLGIPYAQPPVGDLRWKAPQPLHQPHKHVEATKLPPSCMQYLGTGASVYTRNVLEFNLEGLNRTGSISEDCLTLSVWTPSQKNDQKREDEEHYDGDELLPVLIFGIKSIDSNIKAIKPQLTTPNPQIYGGGFQTGGQNVPYQIPTQWVDRTPNHLVVSFNYRLNIFGFPNAAGLSGSQNFGLMDQRAVVEWCVKNIARFGGDPKRMVLWGQSAGSISVDLYNYAHYEDPLVRGLIMDSGTAFTKSTYTVDKTQSNFTFVAEQIGCSGDATAQVDCMRTKSADAIEGFVRDYKESGKMPALAGFDTIPDEKIVFENYTARAEQGLQAKIPAIIGTNAQDGVPFVAYDPNGPPVKASTRALLNAFFCPATETIRLRQQTGRPTFRYVYGGNFTNISPAPWMGAYHSSELPMLMGTYGNFRGPSSELEAATSHSFQDAYVAFAQNPSAGLGTVGWKQYEKLGDKDVREFGVGVAAQDTSLAGLESMCHGATSVS